MDEKNNKSDSINVQSEQTSFEKRDGQELNYENYVGILSSALKNAAKKVLLNERNVKPHTTYLDAVIKIPDSESRYVYALISDAPAVRSPGVKKGEPDKLKYPPVFVRSFAVSDMFDESAPFRSSKDIKGYYIHAGAGKETFGIFVRTKHRNLVQDMHAEVSKLCFEEKMAPKQCMTLMYKIYSEIKSPDFPEEPLVVWVGNILKPMPGLCEQEQERTEIVFKEFREQKRKQGMSSELYPPKIVEGSAGIDSGAENCYSSKMYTDILATMSSEREKPDSQDYRAVDGQLSKVKSVRLRGFVGAGRRSGDEQHFADDIMSYASIGKGMFVHTRCFTGFGNTNLKKSNEIEGYISDVLVGGEKLAQLKFNFNDKNLIADVHTDLFWRLVNFHDNVRSAIEDFIYTWNHVIDEETETRTPMQKKLVELIR